MLDKVQVSLILVTLAMLLALVIAIPLGILAAVRHNKPSGGLISGLSQLGIAIPGFLLGILLVFVSLRLGWLPANGWTPPGEDFGDFIRRIILPVAALAGVQSAILTRYVRSAVLEVMHEDYLRTARAKGLSPTRALLRHGLRNAAIPVLTVTSVQFAALIIGAVVIERVFVVPGLGSMLLTAVGNRDLLTVQSVVMVLVAITLIINLVVDVLYTVLDPRIRRGPEMDEVLPNPGRTTRPAPAPAAGSRTGPQAEHRPAGRKPWWGWWCALRCFPSSGRPTTRCGSIRRPGCSCPAPRTGWEPTTWAATCSPASWWGRASRCWWESSPSGSPC